MEKPRHADSLLTAALIPTLHRPEGLRVALQSLRDTSPSVIPVVAHDADDLSAPVIAREFGAIVVKCEKQRAGCAYAWNTALKAAPQFEAYVMASDDCIFRDGWLELALDEIQTGAGLVGFATDKKTVYCYHYVMTREFIKKYHGGVAAVPHYTSWCVDTEACERAIRAGQYVKLKQALIEHDWKGPDGDETYKLGRDRQPENKKLYHERKKAGFPDDFERILCE